MAQIQGTVLAAKISPGDTTATFPTHEDIYGKGGLMSVQTLTDLATSIPLDRQKVGMLVHVADTSQYFTVSSFSYPLTSLSVFSNVYSTKDYTHGNFVPLSGNAVITGNVQINSNVLIHGNLSASGTSNFANTIFTTTTAISVVHIGDGSAMWVGNNGTGDIASFYDIDQNVEVLHVGGENTADGPGVGIRTSFPNKALTVNGEISANNIIYDANGNSLNWNSVYSSVASTSANWDSVYSSVTSTSANWDGTYSVVSSTSANWDSVYSSVASTSASWDTVYTTVNALSTSWEESADILPTVTNHLSTNNILLSSITVIDDINSSGIIYDSTGNSQQWNSVNSTVASASANWESTYLTVLSLSSEWDNSYNNAAALSANWDGTYSVVSSTSANWDSVYNSVASTSANWDGTYTTTNANSANWDTVYSTVASTSANWDSVYTTTNANSATWTTYDYVGSSFLSLSGGTMYGPIFFGNQYGSKIDQGNYDSSRGGISGISLVCSVNYDFNWQAGWITALEQDRVTPRPLYIDSAAGTTLKVWDSSTYPSSGIEISHNNIIFKDNTVQSTAFTTTDKNKLEAVYDNVTLLSANWDNGYTTTNANSANWDGTYTTTNANSANWDNGYTTTNANSANWDNTYNTVASTSANWDGTYTTTNANSANWDLGYEGYVGLAALSSNWDGTYTTTNANSANWDTVYTTVNVLSTSWEESADILPTVTNYLSTNNITISSVTVSDTFTSTIHIFDEVASKTFIDSDTCKVFHFDTSTQSLCAIFPSTLANGFSVSIMNIGTNNLRLSAAQLNSVGINIGVRYGGAYIYKDNNQLFAVGRL